MFPFCYIDTGYSQYQYKAPGQRCTCRHAGNEKTNRCSYHKKGYYSPQDLPCVRCSVSIHCKAGGNKQEYHSGIHRITCLSICMPISVPGNYFTSTYIVDTHCPRPVEPCTDAIYLRLWIYLKIILLIVFEYLNLVPIQHGQWYPSIVITSTVSHQYQPALYRI